VAIGHGARFKPRLLPAAMTASSCVTLYARAGARAQIARANRVGSYAPLGADCGVPSRPPLRAAGDLRGPAGIEWSEISEESEKGSGPTGVRCGSFANFA
jgi:hypothetical protein